MDDCVLEKRFENEMGGWRRRETVRNGECGVHMENLEAIWKIFGLSFLLIIFNSKLNFPDFVLSYC
jgi:hypothetical protein